jgi:hypothetical protein
MLFLAASSLTWTTAATNAEQRSCEPCRASAKAAGAGGKKNKVLLRVVFLNRERAVDYLFGVNTKFLLGEYEWGTRGGPCMMRMDRGQSPN